MRNIEKSEWLSDQFDKKYGPGRFEFAKVPDLGAKDAFAEAVNGSVIYLVVLKDRSAKIDPTLGASIFVHTASGTSFEKDPKKVVPFAVASARNAIKAASNEPGIKRFIYTSSSVATTLPKPDVKFTLDQNSWNEESMEVSAKGPYDDNYKYVPSIHIFGMKRY